MTDPIVTLVGGGVSAANLLDELASSLDLDRLHLRLVAQDFERVGHLADHGRHLIAERRPGWIVEPRRTVPDAIDGATVVVVMLRVGGLDARHDDELLAQRFGAPGDEGLGPGGAANALRTLPVLDGLARDLVRLAPDATVLNLVAPLGPTTRLLLDRGTDAIGVCELPLVTERALRAALGDRAELAYAGFNHLGWFWPTAGPELLDLADRVRALRPAVAADLVDPAVLEAFGAVPLKYYYWLHDPAAAARLGISRDPNRAGALIDLRDRARADLAARPDQRSAAIDARPTPWFTDALVPLLASLLCGRSFRSYANIRNGTLVPAFRPESIVEVPVRCDADGLTPEPLLVPVPGAALEFSRRVERFDGLVYEAWRHQDLGRLADAFAEGPHQFDPRTSRQLAEAVATAATTADGHRPRSVPPRRPEEHRMRTTRFETHPSTVTDYVVGPSAWTDDRVQVALRGRPVVAVIDEDVARLHAAAIDALLADLPCLGSLELPGGEHCKTPAQLTSLLAYFEACDLPKHGVVLAIGGGTISDVVGLAALLMRRSVSFVILPTTLLAQVDAAVGGKNGINSPTSKNVMGHFHHPLVVASDPGLLATLPPRDVICGIAECIKVFAVADRAALDRHGPTFRDPGSASPATWTDLVVDAQRVKLRLLADDPYEESSRRLLNYGHAFAHMLEERSGYRLVHGEAVLLGMLIENEISRELGIAGADVEDLQQLIVDLVPRSCLSHWVPFELVAPDLGKVRHMRRAAMNLVCVEAVGGAVIVDDAPDEVLAAAWRRVEERLALPSPHAEALT